MKSVCLALAFAAFTARAALVPADLRCDYAVDPLGVDSDHPRLFWKLPGNGRDQKQTAYQILAASSAAALSRNDGDLWDSGKVASDETVQLLYGGKKLASFERVFW
ncbi:MAG TPA: alpha-rhamnosidase, partial [Verrucomicrobiae bacterium]|nr:alpha-rhamnosidase [Verrucomicrobiae bacterium]